MRSDALSSATAAGGEGAVTTWWPPRWTAPVTGALTILGAAAAGYLTYAHYTTATALACPDTGTINCLKVTTSPQSSVFGVLPVAVLGLAYFAALLVLMNPWAWRSAWPVLRWARLAAVLGGICMVVYLVYVELFSLDAICLYCTAVHVITFLLFVTTALATATAAQADVDLPEGEPADGGVPEGPASARR